MAIRPEWYSYDQENNERRCEYFISRNVPCNRTVPPMTTIHSNVALCRCVDEGMIGARDRMNYGYTAT